MNKILEIFEDLFADNQSGSGTILKNVHAQLLSYATENKFLNKASTFPITLLCKNFSVPVYVLAESRKEINHSKLPDDIFEKIKKETKKEDVELYHGNSKKVEIFNYYFEFTPLTLVDKLFLK